MLDYQKIPELSSLTKTQLKRMIWALGLYATYYRQQFLDIREYLADILPTLLDFSRILDIVGGTTDQEHEGQTSPDES